MKIFVTGSESFVGKELVKASLENGIEVSGCDLVQENSQPYNFHSTDIRSKELRDIIPEGVDAVIHLAAIARDGDCKLNPVLCYDVNLSGTVNVADSARVKNAKQIIFASTEWVYGSFKPGEVKNEDTAVDPAALDSDYAFSKILAETAFRERFRISSIPTTILRFGIIYGPRFPAGSAADSIFIDVATKEEVKVNSLATGRHFIHVSDIANGIIKSFGLKGLHTINLVGDRLITLGDIIETSKKMLGKNPMILELDPQNISERRLTNTMAKELIGWAPEIDIETGLKTLLSIIPKR